MSRSHSASLTSGGSLLWPLGLGRPEGWTPPPGYDGGRAAGGGAPAGGGGAADAAAAAAAAPASPSAITRDLLRREGLEPRSSPPQGIRQYISLRQDLLELYVIVGGQLRECTRSGDYKII